MLGSYSISVVNQRISLLRCSRATGSRGFHSSCQSCEKNSVASATPQQTKYLYLTYFVSAARSFISIFRGLGTTREPPDGQTRRLLQSRCHLIHFFFYHLSPPLPSHLLAPPLLFCSSTGINIYAGMWHILDGNTSGCSLLSIHSCHAASYQGAMGLLHLVSTPTPNPF